jgi:hypothetical protein
VPKDKAITDAEAFAAIEPYLKFLPRAENTILGPQLQARWAQPLAKLIGPKRGRGRPRSLTQKPQRDLAIALMLLKLESIGFHPTRRARKRYLEQDKSASAVVASFFRCHGVNIGEPGVEDVWKRLKRGRRNLWDETKLIKFWWSIEVVRKKLA